jgi:DNA-binding LytR/AlgR family response regulator
MPVTGPVICARCHRAMVAGTGATVFRRHGGDYEFVPVERVLYVQARTKGLEFVPDSGSLWFEYGTLAEFMAAHGATFVRISRSLAVRANAIASLHRLPVGGRNRRHQVELPDGRRLDIARRFWKQVLADVGVPVRRGVVLGRAA